MKPCVVYIDENISRSIGCEKTWRMPDVSYSAHVIKPAQSNY
jgi:hypothetical protein